MSAATDPKMDSKKHIDNDAPIVQEGNVRDDDAELAKLGYKSECAYHLALSRREETDTVADTLLQ